MESSVRTYLPGMLLLLLLMYAPEGHAQFYIPDTKYGLESLKGEDTGIFSISEKDWQALVSDKAFFYKDSVEYKNTEILHENPKPSGLSSVLNHIFEFFFSVGGRFLFWLIALGAVIYLLYRIFLGRQTFFFTREGKKEVQGQAPDTLQQNVLETDWALYVKNALYDGNFRLAIRYRFLEMIQLLHRKGYIVYSKEKTDLDYYRSIQQLAIQQLFRSMMLQYEYAWFGKFDTGEPDWQVADAYFKQIESQA